MELTFDEKLQIAREEGIEDAEKIIRDRVNKIDQEYMFGKHLDQSIVVSLRQVANKICNDLIYDYNTVNPFEKE